MHREHALLAGHHQVPWHLMVLVQGRGTSERPELLRGKLVDHRGRGVRIPVLRDRQRGKRTEIFHAMEVLIPLDAVLTPPADWVRDVHGSVRDGRGNIARDGALEGRPAGRVGQRLSVVVHLDEVALAHGTAHLLHLDAREHAVLEEPMRVVRAPDVHHGVPDGGANVVPVRGDRQQLVPRHLHLLHGTGGVDAHVVLVELGTGAGTLNAVRAAELGTG